MIIDLSGFTALTEALMQKGHAGAEELSHILNDIFAPMVRLVYARRGHIPCFAGDSFAAVFSARSSQPEDITQTALDIRHLFSGRSYQFGDFTIDIRIGLSCGTVEWGIVGKRHKAFYLRGEPIDKAAYCQSQAQHRQIILGDCIAAKLAHKPVEMEPVTDRLYSLSGKPNPDARSEELPISIRRETLESFLPDSVINYNLDGEFRSVVTLFLSFKGLKDHEELNAFAGILLERCYEFSGYFKEIEYGDKGGVAAMFFGAPVTFERIHQRALECVEAMREDLDRLRKEIPTLTYRVGMSMGTAFTGIVGGEERCQYAAVGKHVNLAARLMTQAGWQEILVDAEVQKSPLHRFSPKGDIRYKGFQTPIPTYLLLGRNYDFRQAYSSEFFGRSAEVEQLMEQAAPLFENRPAGITYVYGEPGIGKSRLTYELRQQLQSRDISWFFCPADQILRKPFNPFIYFLREYFLQDPEGKEPVNRQAFESRLQELLTRLEKFGGKREKSIARELKRLKSVLAANLSLFEPGSLWDQLDAKGRYANTLAAIAQLIQAEACLAPLVLQVEDIHWIDDSSVEQLQELLRTSHDLPLWVLMTSRYHDEGSKPRLFTADFLTSYGIPEHEIDLNNLSKEDVRLFAEHYLKGALAPAFHKLLLRTTNANPFYLEQILEYLVEQRMIAQESGQWQVVDQNITLSDSIQAILTARIDRLSLAVKETVKAAAVIGREFDLPILREVMRHNDVYAIDEEADQTFREQIEKAKRGQIWMAINELRYLFRHSLLREAAYSMQLRARLQHLHELIAQAIESLYADKLEDRYIDLAFHYEQAGAREKTVEYLEKAARYALDNYQNQQALSLLDRLLGQQLELETLELTEHLRTQLRKAQVQELIGEWDECEQTCRHAMELAKRTRDVLLLGRCNNQLGRVLLLKGDYPEARTFLQTAARLFESVDDRAGIARVYGNLGNLYFRQGQYPEAKTHFLDSLAIRQQVQQRTIDTQVVSNLGLTFMNQGKYDEGIRVMREQLEKCELKNDKPGMATIYTYMGIVYLEKGDYDHAMDSFQRGLQLNEELGNKMLLSVVIGNIGIVNQRRGKYQEAMERFQRDLELCEELGDKQGIAIALGLIGELHSIQGAFYKAIEYLQKNLMLCEELGYQKGIAKAVNTLGDVFYFLENYDRSLHFYNRAIEVTRSIGNKLVLGFSLVEKGAVLIASESYGDLQSVLREALDIARELGNPDLFFEAKVLEAKVKVLQKEPEAAVAILKALLRRRLNQGQQATAWYELYKADPLEQTYRERARALFDELYTATPRHLFRHRLEELSADPPPNAGAPSGTS